MNIALLRENKKLITIDEFMRRGLHKKENSKELTICPDCKEIVVHSSTLSLNVKASFRHLPKDKNSVEKRDCIYSTEGQNRYSHLTSSERDERLGVSIRKRFYDDLFFKRSLSFMFKACGKGVLKKDKICSVLHKANAIDVWSYANIEAWMIPYFLLALGDFVTPEERGSFGFYFLFASQKRFKIEEMLKNTTGYVLERRYADSSNPYVGKYLKPPFPWTISKSSFFENSDPRRVKMSSELFRELILIEE